MRPNNGAIKLVAGNSNPALADAIAAHLETPLTKAVVRRFADMEIFVEIMENVRGTDAFVVQSTSYPANDHLMELLIIIDALRRASARRITAVIPYFGYARQDRKSGSRTPISAKLVANLITHAGADRVLSGGAIARITASRLKELVITDSIQPTEAVRVADNIRVLSIATLIGEAIARTAEERSVSSLFD